MAKKKKQEKAIIGLLILVVAVVGIMLIARTANQDTATLGAINYEVGALNETGEYVKDTSSIVSKKMHSVKDLTIEVKKDAMVTYKVFFFDKDGEFVSADSTANTADYVGAVPETAEYFMIVITPTNDAEVSWTEINDYAGQLEVSYSK